MRLIPAVDILDGKCVRLAQGKFDTVKIYHKDPLEVAKMFEDQGIEYLHLVDLDGAKSKHIVNYKILEKICNKTNLKVDFGGGLKSDEDLYIAFESGANQITGGSIAVKEPEIFARWLHQYSSEKIILGADAKDRKIATTGWLETSQLEVVSFIQNYEKLGGSYVICTDIAKDGMLAGPSFDLYKEIIHKTKVKLIASGGVSSIDDLILLRELGCEGAIIGKALYEGKIPINKLRELC